MDIALAQTPQQRATKRPSASFQVPELIDVSIVQVRCIPRTLLQTDF